MAAVGLPEHVAQHISTMARLHREDRYNRATDDVERSPAVPRRPSSSTSPAIATCSPGPVRPCSTAVVDRTAFDRLFDMTDRTVIVTGGTRGIGLALAEGFVLAGARVVVASRKADACEPAAAHLRELGGQAIGVPDAPRQRRRSRRPRAAHGRRVRRRRRGGEQRRQCARPAAGGDDRRGVDQVIRGESARPGVPGAAGAAAPEGQPRTPRC